MYTNTKYTNTNTKQKQADTPGLLESRIQMYKNKKYTDTNTKYTNTKYTNTNTKQKQADTPGLQDTNTQEWKYKLGNKKGADSVCQTRLVSIYPGSANLNKQIHLSKSHLVKLLTVDQDVGL